MDVDKIKELIELMKTNDLNELKIKDGETRILLRRGAKGNPQIIQMPHQPLTAPMPAPAAAPAAPAPVADENAGLIEITSPMVGSFYAAPSPNAESFVKVGDHVDTDTVVCIVEAMKVMNEVKSEVKGTIKKILASNGQAVEFGTALYLVEPD
ncbi:MAG: acetyl-CoA carboxylase biotin carboxyl carrier protein [Sedimentisphaerales bacterium]|nr:acetyl-CoA carboxylase biotin carboxyl carrier protein [Sedimentisphaerales bacterium]